MEAEVKPETISLKITIPHWHGGRVVLRRKVKDEAGVVTPTDFTGWGGELVVRTSVGSDEEILRLSLGDGFSLDEEGFIYLDFDPEKTRPLAPGVKYVFGVTLEPPAGYSLAFAEGVLILDPTASRPAASLIP